MNPHSPETPETAIPTYEVEFANTVQEIFTLHSGEVVQGLDHSNGEARFLYLQDGPLTISMWEYLEPYDTFPYQGSKHKVKYGVTVCRGFDSPPPAKSYEANYNDIVRLAGYEIFIDGQVVRNDFNLGEAMGLTQTADAPKNEFNENDAVESIKKFTTALGEGEENIKFAADNDGIYSQPSFAELAKLRERLLKARALPMEEWGWWHHWIGLDEIYQ